MENIQAFTFFSPTRIEFGKGAVGRLADEAGSVGASRPLVVTDSGIEKSPLLEPIVKDLRKAGMKVEVFSKVEPNPRDSTCHEGAEVAKRHEADLIIAVGGGSPMDAAKAISMLSTNPGNVHDYFGLLQGQEAGPALDYRSHHSRDWQ
jgi:alcohol dehydrogenase